MSATQNIPYSQEAQSIFNVAKNMAETYCQSNINTECILFGIISNVRISKIIEKFVSLNNIQSRIENSLAARDRAPSGTIPVFSNKVNIIRISIENEAVADGSSVISPDHVLLGVLRHPHFTAGIILNFYGIDYKNAKNELAAFPPFVSTTSTQTRIANNLKNLLSSFQSKTNAAVNAASIAVDSVAHRAEWHDILDSALDLSKNSGLSVISAFVHVATTHPNFMKGTCQQIRQETIADMKKSITNAINTISDISK